MIRAIKSPVYKSRTMATLIVLGADKATPCKIRPAIIISRLVA